MKKSLTILLSIIMLLCIFSICVSAKDTVSVTVKITDDAGLVTLANKSVTVKDIDNDNLLTINDALFCAHETYYNGGAKSGYSYESTDFGLSLTKLWGVVNGMSYGYYRNNNPAMSLSDAISDGDYISAFCYTDLDSYTDTYCYFDKLSATAKFGEKITLTLKYASFDAEFNPIPLPVENATIIINGKATDYKTNENGVCEITADISGELIISAKSDTQNLVAPVILLTVAGNNDTKSDIDTLSDTSDTDIKDVDTGADSLGFVLPIAIIILMSISLLTAKKKSYEK